MTRCGSCGSDNPEQFSFCGSCGASLAAGGCPTCGYVNPQGQRFCGQCGGLLLADAVHPTHDESGERKLATVLFADVVGFTALAETSDPEALARTVDSAMRRMTDVVTEHGGTIDKYIGDALMALFGVPVAHGDDAERAVAAALRMCEIGGDLRFAIGINTGEVMVTTVGEHGAVTVIGDAVNVAARLENAAGAGEILVGPTTAELVADRFTLREREPTVLKGKSQPVAVFEVTGIRVDSGDLQRSAAPRLVGRDAELDFARSCWRRTVERGRTEVMLLTGEAGMGKTRLAEELAARSVGAGEFARAACAGYGALVGARLAAQLDRQLSSGGDADGPDSPAADFSPDSLWRLRRLIAARTEAGPLLLLIDDVHNAKDQDLAALGQLVGRIADLPVLLLLAGRTQPSDWMGRFAGATTLRLEPLTTEEGSALAASLAGELPLAEQDAALIASRAGGNPLHIRELIRLLRSGGGLVADAGEYRLSERRQLPPTLQSVLGSRLDALPAAEKAVLQDAAVFTEGASAAEIAALAGGDSQPELDHLATAGLLRQREGRYEVADPLLREVAYEQLSHAARADRHRRAASIASTPLGRARHLGLAADYLPDDAALRVEAADQLARIGIELIGESRFRDGIQLVRQALELGHDDPHTLLRLAAAETDMGHTTEAIAHLDQIVPDGDPVLEAELVHTRGTALRLADPLASLELLADAAERWGALGNQHKRAWALANRGMTLFDMGHITEAADSNEAALEIFRGLGDRHGAAATGRALALQRPEDPRVPGWLADGLAHADETGDLVQQRNALITLAWYRFLRGNLGGAAQTEPARRDAEQLARVCADLGDSIFQMQGHCIVAVIERLAGNLSAAEERVRRARSATAVSERYSEPLLEAVDFMVRLARGGDATSRPHPATGFGPIPVLADSLVIEALLLAGHADAAVDHTAGSSLGEVSGLAAFLVGVTKGAVMVFAGRCSEAEESLVATRESARVVGAYPTEVAATALLAEVELDRGDAAKARELLETLTDDAGGVAALLCERVRSRLGDAAATERLRRGAAALAVPGLAEHLVKT